MADPFSNEQAEQWEAVARGKIQVLRELAKVAAAGEQVSSGYLAQHCGLSREEWHGSGELLAALLFFAVEKGFLAWHAKSMFDTPEPPDA